MTSNPGLRNQAGARRAFRIAGLVLAPVGVVLVVVGFYRFVTTDPGLDSGAPDGFVMFALGGVLTVVGFGCLNAGFLGSAARYGAGETMPVVKDSAAYLSDGEGILGVGRTAGPYCSACGVRNDAGARFCDSCGTAIT